MGDFQKAFYFVFGESGDDPKHRHGTQEEAIIEAKRLAEKHQGKKFHVCRAICTVEKPTGLVMTNYGRKRDHEVIVNPYYAHMKRVAEQLSR